MKNMSKFSVLTGEIKRIKTAIDFEWSYSKLYPGVKVQDANK